MTPKQRIILAVLFILMILFAQTVVAEQSETSQQDHFFLQTTLLTHHWDNDSDTNNVQDLLGLEYHLNNSQLYGLSYFENSAFQSSWYLYKGKIFPWKKINDFKLYGKLTYGVITGYDDENGRYTATWYELGTFPAVLPSIGIEYESFILEASMFANQGVILHGGIKF